MRVEEIPKLALVVGISGFMLAAIALGLTAFNDTLTANSYAANITTDMLTTLDNITTQLPTVGTIIGIAILVGVVVGGFVYAGGRYFYGR